MAASSFVFDPAVSSAVDPSDGPSPASALGETSGPLSTELLQRMHRYWMAANYLTVGQIYLQENPLLREPLRAGAHQAAPARPLGDVAGLSLSTCISIGSSSSATSTSSISPGPGTAARRSSRTCISRAPTRRSIRTSRRTWPGCARLFRQFSTPGGIPSHVSVPTPGSIHEGGELGYVLSHAFGAAFDNPDLIVAAVVGDGEAETAPLEGSWKGIELPQSGARRRGAPDPASQRLQDRAAPPCSVARRDEDIRALLEGHGYDVHFVAGDDPMRVHQALARDARRLLSTRSARSSMTRARSGGIDASAALAGHRAANAERVDRARGRRRPAGRGNVPRRTRCRSPTCARTRSTSRCSKRWLKSYGPEKLFDERGRLVAELAALAPKGDRRMGANPHANGGRLLEAARPARLSRLRGRRRRARAPSSASRRASSARCCATSSRATPSSNFRLFCPDETNSNRLGARVRGGEPLLRRADDSTSTITSPPTDASWRC